MQITQTNNFLSTRSISKQPTPSDSASKAPSDSAPVESFSFADTEKTPTIVKVGKYALATAATVGAGALAMYASKNVGTAATVAGVASGGLAGATILGTVGLLSDIGGGFLGSSDNMTPMLIGGGVGGAALGGYIGAAVENPVAGGVMAFASGAAALALVSSATNIGAK